MRISARGLALIRHFEGFSAVPYRCPAGYWTIGYGHVLSTRERETITVIDAKIADTLLMQDVRSAENTVRRLISLPLTEYQFDALVSFTYNLGGAALQRSRLRRCVNRGEHVIALEEFSKWVWAGGKKLSGLIQRRHDESIVYQGLGLF